jgi:S-(hydroxymethyl)glutathione dehydrogenase/alcohol dehydrogenase
MRTKTAVVYEHNQPVVVDELTLDDPKKNEVVIRMGASGVCHSDLSVVNGTIYYNPPVALGHEGAGVVERIGENVSYVRPGDHVVLSFVSYCGQCRYCQMGRVILCDGFSIRPGRLLDDSCRLHNRAGDEIPQMARIGTMSEYSIVPEINLVKIDPHYSLAKAALVGCGVATGVGAVLNTAKVEPGSWVVVIGAGGVGLNAVQGAVLADAERIIVVDRVAQKLELAKAFGATDVVDASAVDPVEAVRALTQGKGVDYAFEVIGNPATIEQAYQMTRRAGTTVVVGLTRPDTKVSIPAQNLAFSEKRLIGCFYGSISPRVDMPKLLQWYDEGKLKLDELITQTYRLEQINEAFADMEAGKNARGVILF